MDIDINAEKWCARAGYGCVAVFLIGFWLVAGFIPPPRPGASAAVVAEFYRDNRVRVILGMIISMAGATLTGPWIAAITMQLRRTSPKSTVLVLTQLILGVNLVLEFILCLMIWEVAAFRADRSDESIQLLNDLGWIPFIGLTGTAIVQAFTIAVIILRDRREAPVLPRWAAYVNIWVGLSFFSSSINALFKNGPFAWDGVLSFYLAMVAFCSWYVVNSYVVLKALARQGGASQAQVGKAPTRSWPDDITNSDAEPLGDRVDSPRPQAT
jgi:hypothetical protein